MEKFIQRSWQCARGKCALEKGAGSKYTRGKCAREKYSCKEWVLSWKGG